MSLNRKPHYTNGFLLVGDAGGMVSPFNGEGIAPAMKAGRYAAEAMAQALSRTHRAGVDRAMSAYPQRVRNEYGGYYQLGRIFVRLIETQDHASVHDLRSAHPAPDDTGSQASVGWIRTPRRRFR